MEDASSDKVLSPRRDQVPRRNYLAQRTRQVQFLPTAEAICLITNNRVRHRGRAVKRPIMRSTSTKKSGTRVSRISATVSPISTNQTGKVHQESTRLPKPLGISLEGSGSNPNPCLNDNNESKAGFGAGKQKGIKKLASKTFYGVSSSSISLICSGQEIAVAHKRKLDHEAKLDVTGTAESRNP